VETAGQNVYKKTPFPGEASSSLLGVVPAIFYI
jgi:hypothetical protein